MPTLYKDSPKLATEHLVEPVQPVGLQDILRSDRDLQHKDLKKNFSGWVKHIRERAVAYEIYHGSSAGKASKKTPNAGPATKSGGSSGGGGGNGVSGGGGAGNGDSTSKSTSEKSNKQMGKDKASDKKKPSSEGSAKEQPLCLNKSKCQSETLDEQLPQLYGGGEEDPFGRVQSFQGFGWKSKLFNQLHSVQRSFECDY
jgi:hypothetical protein